MKKAITFLLVLIAASFAATFPVEGNYRSKSDMYQLVEPSNEAALFGEIGEKIGSPQMYVVFDQKAVLPSPEGEQTKFLNNTYLKQHGLYPLQMKTVSYLVGIVRIALGIAFLLALALLLMLRARSSKAART